MGKAFTAASTLFIIAELLSAYQQYFDTDATQMDGLSPGAFRGYSQFAGATARQSTPPCPSHAWPALRTIEFYSMWVGNSKARRGVSRAQLGRGGLFTYRRSSFPCCSP